MLSVGRTENIAHVATRPGTRYFDARYRTGTRRPQRIEAQMLKSVLAMTVLLTACATAPKVHEFQKTWAVPSTYDQAWSATVQLFAENGWPIATLEKDSGIIVSDWVNLSTQGGHADCGSAGLAIVQRREAKFNVFIRDGASGPVLTVNTNFRELRSFDNRSFYADCTSTGSLEAQLHSQILARIK